MHRKIILGIVLYKRKNRLYILYFFVRFHSCFYFLFLINSMINNPESVLTNSPINFKIIQYSDLLLSVKHNKIHMNINSKMLEIAFRLFIFRLVRIV